jgi:hypothetical protein
MKTKALNCGMFACTLFVFCYVAFAAFTGDALLPMSDVLFSFNEDILLFFRPLILFAAYGCMGILTTIVTFSIIAKILGLNISAYSYGNGLSTIHFSTEE